MELQEKVISEELDNFSVKKSIFLGAAFLIPFSLSLLLPCCFPFPPAFLYLILLCFPKSGSKPLMWR